MTKLKLFGAAMLGAAVSLPAIAGPQQAKQPEHAVPTNIPGIYAFPQPPKGFDPSTASAKALAEWGYAPRPAPSEGPETLNRWMDSVGPAMHRVIPQLAPRPGAYNLPVRGLQITGRGVNSTAATSANWSGYALANGTQPFYQVTGRWTVPPVQQAPKTCSGGWDYSSQWVGIDGFNNQDLLQAGSAANVFCDVGNNIAEYFPWIEWLPASELVLYKTASTSTLYPFAPGDYLTVTVWATNFSGGASTTGNVQFSDITQHWIASLTFSAASVGGSQVVGQSAEWIVERTQVNGSFATLPNYTADPWVMTSATDLGSTVYYPGRVSAATAYNITMQDNNNANVSKVDIFGPDSLWFYPEGSATQ